MDAGNLTDGELAAQLAARAGELLLARRAALLADGRTGKELGAAGDLAANALICDALRQARPADGLLSEEEKDNPARLGKSRVWIIDPLDGTREFGEARGDWAVHVALAIDGVPVLGAVALPDLGLVLRSDAPGQVPPPPRRLRMVVSRTRPAADAMAVAAALDAEIIPMGSAGAKAMAVVRGEADIYLHSGGQYEWDSCAPVAVALGHGLHASRIDGSPLVYNQPDTYMADLLVCRRAHAGLVLERLAEAHPA